MGKPKVAPPEILGGLVEVIVKMEPYGDHVFCVAGPREDLPAYMRWRHKIKREVPSKAEASALYFPAVERIGGVIWIPRRPRLRTKDYGYLVHEAGHAVLDLFGGVDIAVTAKHQEPFCYAIGFLVEEILKKLRLQAA